MKFLKFIGLATGLLWCIGVHAEIVIIQGAIEAHDIKVVINSSTDGYVLARNCETCPFTRLGIDSKTTVTVDGKPVKINKRIEKHWSGGIVIYDIETNRVARLKL
jgi:hypothetical protein